MKYLLYSIIIFVSYSSKAQNPGIMCLPLGSQIPINRTSGRSVNDVKTVRINYHFMLKSDGTGNFNELTDGDGRTYSGFDYAIAQTKWMQGWNSWNEQMNIPPNNTTPVNSKNFYYILDGVYFHRNDATYNYPSINGNNYPVLGVDRDSVLNIFLTRSPYVNTEGDTTAGGYASGVNPMSKTKYTENLGYWQGYKFNVNGGYPFDWFLHGSGSQFNHELCHLMSLSHTVKYDWAPSCPTNCTTPKFPGGTPVDLGCDDGCNDTPTAWDIAQLSGCTKHPDCGWGTGGTPYCSNNLMDYSGSNALTPCQIGLVHGALEGGMRSYLACAACSVNKTYCDIGYPKMAYFGKNVFIGNCGTLANVTNKEKLTTYFSSSVELTNFEVRSDSEFEVIYQGLCNF